MSDELHRRIVEVFREACDLAPDRREIFLRHACAGDDDLRREIDRLLDSDGAATGFLEQPAPAMDVRHGDVVPGSIGPYRVLQPIGEGGFAVVYLAEQTEPVRRRVAVKVIKRGMDSREVLARFEAERQALALMDHPGVAQVYDAGLVEDGRPYFVMEHVAGVPITEHCDRERLTIAERLQLFTEVCQAVHHAHQKGIIHRDIKPSNVLVASRNGAAAPKVIDFGVAKALYRKLTDRTLYTEIGQLIGTPEYMSPEQAEMTSRDIDTRSDIYSLGALLYELLTGSLPFDSTTLRSANLLEIQRMIREEEPVRPSTKLNRLGPRSTTCAGQRHTDTRTLRRELRGDLDWIVMRAMEKSRDRRYESAAALAADIQRHLRHEPVVAGPPGGAYRIRKFIRRHRAGVAAGAVVVAALIAATIVSIAFAVAAGRAQRVAQTRADDLETITAFQQDMLASIDVEAVGDGLISALRREVRRSLEGRGLQPREIDTEAGSLDGLLAFANATDAARTLLDDHVLSRAISAIDEQFAERAWIQAALRQTVATVYRELGLYDAAHAQQTRALATRREHLGDDDPHTLESIAETGELLLRMGRIEAAEEYVREALDGRRAVLGPDHRDTLDSMSDLAAAMRMRGAFDEAHERYREILDRCLTAYGRHDRDTLSAMNNLGALLWSMERFDDADALLRDALDGYRRLLGEHHPATLSAMNNLGSLARAMGHVEEAERHYRAAYEGRRSALGDDHPRTLRSLSNLSSLLVSMNRLDEAEATCREVLARRRTVLGTEHPRTLASLYTLGLTLRRMGRLQEAAVCSKESLDGRRRIHGNDHPATLDAMVSHATVLRESGDLNAASDLGAEAVNRAHTALPERSDRLAVYLSSHGETLTELGSFAAAEASLLEAHEILAGAGPGSSARLDKVIGRLLELYTRWDQADPGAGHASSADAWRQR